MWLLATYGQHTGGLTPRVVWPGLSISSRLAPFHIHHMNRVNSRSGSSYDDSTINIISLITVIIIIARLAKMCFGANVFTSSVKQRRVTPLLKKSGLDHNYRPVSHEREHDVQDIPESRSWHALRRLRPPDVDEKL